MLGWTVVPTDNFLDDERFDPPLRERCIARIVNSKNVQKLAKK